MEYKKKLKIYIFYLKYIYIYLFIIRMSEYTEIKTTNSSNNLLFIRTKKIPAIKSLFEALKEIFKDVNIKFMPKVEKINKEDGSVRVSGGMYIIALNSNSSIYVRMHLEADKFCYYECNPIDPLKNHITLGVNMTNLFKLIKYLNNDDELYMIYNKENINQFNLKYVNKMKKLTTNFYLNLLDLADQSITVGKQDFDFVITMPSNDFHGLIKVMSGVADQVDIKLCSETVVYDNGKTVDKYSLKFYCKGEFVEFESSFDGCIKTNDIDAEDEDKNNDDNTIGVFRHNDGSGQKNDADTNKETIIQGIYELKSLSLFSRCSSLCSNIELYIKNNSPLVIKYRVADMGSVHLMLSQINNPELNDDSDSELDDDNDNI